jgi:hypothetical protein
MVVGERSDPGTMLLDVHPRQTSVLGVEQQLADGAGMVS